MPRPKRSCWDAAQEALVKKRKMLSEIKPIMEVKGMAHVRSPELKTFCVDKLIDGTTYEELRRLLGLGPAHKDILWRKLREILSSEIAERVKPDNPDSDKLFAASTQETIWWYKEKIKEIECIISKASEDTLPHLYDNLLKYRDRLVAIDRGDQMAVFTKQRIRAMEKQTSGVSIIFQNLYHMPRPGDDKLEREVKETPKELSGSDSKE